MHRRKGRGHMAEPVDMPGNLEAELKRLGLRLPQSKTVDIPEDIGVHLHVGEVEVAEWVRVLPTIAVTRLGNPRERTLMTLNLRGSRGEVTIFVSDQETASSLLRAAQEIREAWPPDPVEEPALDENEPT